LSSRQRTEIEIQKKKLEKIAIVDDEESLCALFSLMAKKLGYSTEFTAHNGREIVTAVLNKTISPDLIIMDYRMPVMNGLQAAELIRKNEPEIPILIASADDTIRDSAESLGLNYLQKPFNFRQFSEALNQAYAKGRA
jgi:CheY-like chemotaxis protein